MAAENGVVAPWVSTVIRRYRTEGSAPFGPKAVKEVFYPKLALYNIISFYIKMSIRNINKKGGPWTRSFDTVLVKTDHVGCDQLVHPSGAVLPVDPGDGCHRELHGQVHTALEMLLQAVLLDQLRAA